MSEGTPTIRKTVNGFENEADNGLIVPMSSLHDDYRLIQRTSTLIQNNTEDIFLIFSEGNKLIQISDEGEIPIELASGVVLKATSVKTSESEEMWIHLEDPEQNKYKIPVPKREYLGRRDLVSFTQAEAQAGIVVINGTLINDNELRKTTLMKMTDPSEGDKFYLWILDGSTVRLTGHQSDQMATGPFYLEIVSPITPTSLEGELVSPNDELIGFQVRGKAGKTAFYIIPRPETSG